MKKKKFICNLLTLLVVSLLGMFVTSCHDDLVTVNMSSVNFGENGGSQTIEVTSNTNWSISGCPSWLTINPPQGKKNGSFTIIARANSNETPNNCVLYVNAGDAYAMITISQAGHVVVPETKVTITNGSTYTLPRFTLVFLNSRNELLTERDYGTLYPNDFISADIPTGATKYYMATYISGYWFLSPDYDITYKKISLSNAEIGNWTTN